MVVDEPLSAVALASALEVPVPDVEAELSAMEEEYAAQFRGFSLRRVGDGWRYYSRADYAPVVERFLLDGQQARLTQAALETLAVIAYRQPVTRSDVERVRGVRCDYAVTQLQKLGLIVEVGRKDVVGHPTLFGTTDKFLRQFGIHALEEMPNFPYYSQEILEDSSEEIPVV